MYVFLYVNGYSKSLFVQEIGGERDMVNLGSQYRNLYLTLFLNI